MKIPALIKLAVITNVVAANLIAIPSVKANIFDEEDLNRNRVIAVATPYRHGYKLVVIEQIPGKEKCWSERGITPITVDPLLMNFDFTSHCHRATDSNGYSIRIDGEERGSDYLLEIVEQDDELVLIATQRDPARSPLVLGRTHGKSDGLTKIFLDPGWRLTKRSYRGKELSHFYFSKGTVF